MNRPSKVAVLAISTLSLTACLQGIGGIRGSGDVKTETRTVSGFKAVELAGIGKLKIEQTGSESLTVEADDNLLSYLTTEVHGTRLVIGTKPNANLRPTKPIVFRLTVKNLDNLALSGSGNIETGDINSKGFVADLNGSGNLALGRITAPRFELHSSGSGNFKSQGIKSDEARLDASGSGSRTINNLDTKTLNVDQSSSGSIRLSGRSDGQEIEMTGSGSYAAESLDSRTATITTIGSGSATLKVSEKLNATITGSGSVTYSGEAEVQKNVSGSGRVNKR